MDHRVCRILLKAFCVVLAGLFTAVAMLSGMVHHARAQAPSASPAQQALVINEVMASNSSGLEDPDNPGKFPDWLEIYNPNDTDTALDGLFLIKGELADSRVYTIPQGLSAPANGFILFYADNDDNQGPLHTTFNLNKDKDRVGLYGDGMGGEEIDSVRFQAQVTNVSIGRTRDGQLPWRPFTRSTPGRSNSSMPPLIMRVSHEPALPSNTESVTVTAIISDDGPIAQATVIYSVTGGSTTIPVPMSQVSGSLYRVVLPPRPNGSLVQYYVEAIDEDGERAPDLNISGAHWRAYPVGYEIPQLVINEVIPDNINLLEDPDDAGDFADLIELYNAGESPVSLDGLYITDNLANRTKFAFNGSLAIQPGDYLLLYADEDQEQGPAHTNFRLNKEGESVGLYGARGYVQIDQLTFREVSGNRGFGRFPDGADTEPRLLYCATPGAANIDCDQATFVPIVTR